MCRNVKGNKYLCNRIHISRKSNRSFCKSLELQLRRHILSKLAAGSRIRQRIRGHWWLSISIWVVADPRDFAVINFPITHVPPLFLSFASRRIICVYYQKFNGNVNMNHNEEVPNFQNGVQKPNFQLTLNIQ